MNCEQSNQSEQPRNHKNDNANSYQCFNQTIFKKTDKIITRTFASINKKLNRDCYRGAKTFS